ncbi:hypothetical protein J0E37_001429 [Campylobacter upsaliensis]|nr:hypothetical protein [Campylobacter upsaliensis]
MTKSKRGFSFLLQTRGVFVTHHTGCERYRLRRGLRNSRQNTAFCKAAK